MYLKNVWREILHSANDQFLVLGGAVKVQIEPVSEFDLETYPYKVGALFDGHIDDEPAGQVVENVSGNL